MVLFVDVVQHILNVAVSLNEFNIKIINYLVQCKNTFKNNFL